MNKTSKVGLDHFTTDYTKAKFVLYKAYTIVLYSILAGVSEMFLGKQWLATVYMKNNPTLNDLEFVSNLQYSILLLYYSTVHSMTLRHTRPHPSAKVRQSSH